MKKIVLIIIAVVTVTLASKPLYLFWKYYLTHCPENSPVAQEDFAMYIEPVNVTEYTQSLYAYDPPLTIRSIETIAYQDQEFEILQIDTQGSGDKKMLIFAATHGNEFVSALVISDVLDEMTHPTLYDEWSIRIITPVNPVGLHYQSRYNEEGCDINRDFKNFSTRGARIQKQAVDEYNPDIIVSLHEGSHDDGFYIIAEQSVPEDLLNAVVRDLHANEIKLARTGPFGMPLEKPGIWRKQSYLYFLQSILGIHTLGRYANEKDIPTITTESSWQEVDVTTRKKPHLLLIKSVIENYSE